MSFALRSTRRPWRAVRRAVTLALITAAAACGGSDKVTGPKAPNLAGAWTGTLSGAPVTMTLTSPNNVISGTGVIIVGSSSYTITPSGSVTDAGQFTMTITSTQFQPMIYSGTATSVSLAGSVTGSGFTGETMVLRKQ